MAATALVQRLDAAGLFSVIPALAFTRVRAKVVVPPRTSVACQSRQLRYKSDTGIGHCENLRIFRIGKVVSSTQPVMSAILALVFVANAGKVPVRRLRAIYAP